jgi:hypothetical protein
MAEVKLDPCSSRYALSLIFRDVDWDQHVDTPIGNIDHPFGIGIPVVALVGWSEMDLGLVKRVRDLIWEYTR